MLFASLVVSTTVKYTVTYMCVTVDGVLIG
jgi:hypothetical protein